MSMNPRRQPAADIAAAGNGREVVELFQEGKAGECLKDTQSKRGASDAAARETEGRPLAGKLVDVGVERREPVLFALCLSGQGPMQICIFLFENPDERKRTIIRWVSAHGWFFCWCVSIKLTMRCRCCSTTLRAAFCSNAPWQAVLILNSVGI